MTDQNNELPRIRQRTRLPIRGVPPGRASVVPLPPSMTPRHDDLLDAEIDAALAEGRQVRLDIAFPEPPAAAPGENLAAHRPVPDIGDDPIPSMPNDNMSPQERMRRVSVLAPTYMDEYRSRLLHRLLLRRLPLDVIAAQLGCSVRNVQLMKTKLQKRAARQAKMLNVYDVAAESIRFYHEVRGLALRQVDDRNLPTKERQYAMRIALDAENDKVRFLSASGYFEHSPYIPDQTKNSNPEQEGVDQTLSMLHAVVSNDVSLDDIGNFFEQDELAADNDADYDGMDPSTDLL